MMTRQYSLFFEKNRKCAFLPIIEKYNSDLKAIDNLILYDTSISLAKITSDLYNIYSNIWEDICQFNQCKMNKTLLALDENMTANISDWRLRAIKFTQKNNLTITNNLIKSIIYSESRKMYRFESNIFESNDFNKVSKNSISIGEYEVVLDKNNIILINEKYRNS